MSSSWSLFIQIFYCYKVYLQNTDKLTSLNRTSSTGRCRVRGGGSQNEPINNFMELTVTAKFIQINKIFVLQSSFDSLLFRLPCPSTLTTQSTHSSRPLTKCCHIPAGGNTLWLRKLMSRMYRDSQQYTSPVPKPFVKNSLRSVDKCSEVEFSVVG